MEIILYYLLKSAVCLAAFYLFHKLLLSRETWYCMNRVILLFILAAAFVLPFCVITIYREIAMDSQITIGELATTIVAEDETSMFTWEMFVFVIFIVGCVVRLLLTVYSIYKVRKIISSGVHTERNNGVILVRVSDEISPFSWMKYIVISENDYAENPTEIITHEQAHITLRHSYDILFVDLMTCVQWFNPVIYLLRNDLRELHEYEADEAVLNSGINAKQYQILLIKKAAGVRWNSIANSFNHSKLKNRIMMMTKKKSSKWAIAKVLYVFPLVCVALSAFAQVEEVPVSASDPQVHQAIDNNSPNPLYILDGRELTKTEFDAITTEEIEHVSVLKGASATDKYGEKGKNGVILITLKDDKEGKKEAVVEPVFNVVAKTVVVLSYGNEKEAVVEEPVFNVVEQAPEFSGGMTALMKYIGENIQYPADAAAKKREGRAICQFVVTKSGVITDLRIVRSSGHADLDAEAIRCLKSMPKWKPGEQRGEAVNVKFTLPVSFRLN